MGQSSAESREGNPLQGQVAVVTGASRGLGRALAQVLTENGVRVIMLARPSGALSKAAEELGDSALAYACDVRSSDDVTAAIRQGAERFGRIDILVNNAAACLVNKIESVSDADVHAEIDTNLLGPIWCIRAVVPYMRQAGRGEIINISSESVNAPVPFMTTYAASKAALETFSAGLRNELRAYGIRVTVARSGAMQTSITDQWSDSQKQDFFSSYANSARRDEAGGSIDPRIMALTVVNILKLPPEASVRLVELGGR
jgi:meso-butanediol dehydrogenase / (S,S)-butanediol dehydrogenase / diacetyl reductase